MEVNPESYFTKSEHVVPKSFGAFQDNLTLLKTVCDKCNQWFGDNLEIALGRDTYEGELRFEYGLKSHGEFKSLGKKSRLLVRVEEGAFKGAHAYREYSESPGEIVLKPIPQVGFRKMGDSVYEYYLLDDLPAKQYFDDNGYELNQPGSIRIIPSTCQELFEKALSEKGFTFKPYQVVDPEHLDHDWLCKVEGTIDDTILRAVAKICFNYLSYWQGPEFMLDAGFDVMRRYIRYGGESQYPFIKIRQKPILADESVAGKRRSGHLITVDWAADKQSVVAQISLFNSLTYSICLARGFSGEHRVIRKGHFFDPHNQQIFELGV